MSYVVMVSILCNVCFRQADVAEWTVGRARQEARRDEWHLVGGKRDICPTCWEKGER